MNIETVRYSCGLALFVISFSGCTKSPNTPPEAIPVAPSVEDVASAVDDVEAPLKSLYQPRPVNAVIASSEHDQERHGHMLSVLRALRRRETRSHSYYGTEALDRARQAHAQAQTEDERVSTLVILMIREMNLGNESDALEHMARLQQITRQTIGRIPPEFAARLHQLMGMISLRHGETQNCCLLHNKDSCLLPIRGGGVHTRQDGARMAIAEFQQAVTFAPRDSERYFESIWLWNLAAMALAEFPDSIPAEHRMIPERFLSREKFPRFMNIAPELKLDTNSLCGTVVADDFNNDGYLDLMVGTWDLRDPLKLYLNDGAGGFVDRTSAAGLDGMAGGLNMVQADYNNDGRIDVLVLRGAWMSNAGDHPHSLLRNNGDGTFTDVTFAAGLAEKRYPGQAAGWADYDLDGWLDLFIASEEGPNYRVPCRLYHNNRDGTFTDVAEAAGVATYQLVKGCSWGDYDNDRYPDLYVSVMGGRPPLGARNRLYRNNGDGTFTDVAVETGVADDEASFATWFWDYNNDGVLDLFVAPFDASTTHVAHYYRGDTVEGGMPRLFRGMTDGTFHNASQEMGFEEPTLVMGSNFGDLNNDGWLDMYLGTGSPDYKMIIPNKLYLNHAGERFADVSEAAGMAHLQKGHGVAFADLDADGDQDVFMQMGGAYPVDKFVDALFENPGFGNNYVSVELVGVESNRFGVGSRIRVNVEEDGKTRSIYRWVNSGGSFGCNSMRQQIGIGKATSIKSLEVYWPKSDTTQTFQELPANCIVRITEGAEDYVETHIRPTEFARSPAD